MIRNIERLQHLLPEFSVKPEIIIVWAAPENGRAWIFQNMLQQKKIARLLERVAVPEDGETKYTTYVEGLNFELAFDFIQKNYFNYYIIGQAADIFTYSGVYREIDKYMQQGYDAVLISKKFAALGSKVGWATNLFAVSDNSLYFPPFNNKKKGGSCMEHRWGLSIEDNKLNNYKILNKECYYHAHETEHLTLPPAKFQNIGKSVDCFIMGYKPLRQRIKDFFMGFLNGKNYN